MAPLESSSLAGNWDPRADAWLSGFADGEGCFGIYSDSRRKDNFAPVFDLALRADDAAVLRVLAESVGGRVTYALKRSNGGYPQARWNVSAKKDLRVLASYFRRFPCHAKKADDCALWLRAVELYATRKPANRSEEMRALQAALRGGRVYDAGTVARLREAI